MNHFTKLSWASLRSRKRMTRKLDAHARHAIVKNYCAILQWKSSFWSVSELIDKFKIHRNLPRKLLDRFMTLRKELYPDKEIDYTINVFLKRDKLCKHRSLPISEQYKNFVKHKPRAGYQTYIAECAYNWEVPELKEWMYHYYKQATKTAMNTRKPYKTPTLYKRMSAKERYENQYETYDFIIQLDWKSLEDQEYVWKNSVLKMAYKRISMAVEVKSWIVLWVRCEKSHNKSNSLIIIKEICGFIEKVFWKWKRILFITDAGSEYLNDKKLRWIEVTDLDTSKLVDFLRWAWHSLRITRKPQDNWFIENKNDYIERSCLDDSRIETMSKKDFLEHLDGFLQRNNIFLPWCKKSFRWYWITPLENIQKRFWIMEWVQRVAWLHCSPIETMYWLPREYEQKSLFELIYIARPLLHTYWLKKTNLRFEPFLYTLHTKSLDSSSSCDQQKKR